MRRNAERKAGRARPVYAALPAALLLFCALAVPLYGAGENDGAGTSGAETSGAGAPQTEWTAAFADILLTRGSGDAYREPVICERSDDGRTFSGPYDAALPMPEGFGGEREGYLFRGFVTEADGQTAEQLLEAAEASFERVRVSPERPAVFAVYDARPVEVTFDAGDGSAPASQTFYYDSAPKAAGIRPEKRGCRFLGWARPGEEEPAYASEDGIRFDGSFPEDGRAVFRAVFREYSYEVLFDANLENASGSMDRQVITYCGGEEKGAQRLDANRFLADGYTFAGWRVGDSARIAEDRAAASGVGASGDSNLICPSGPGEEVVLHALWTDSRAPVISLAGAEVKYPFVIYTFSVSDAETGIRGEAAEYFIDEADSGKPPGDAETWSVKEAVPGEDGSYSVTVAAPAGAALYLRAADNADRPGRPGTLTAAETANCAYAKECLSAGDGMSPRLAVRVTDAVHVGRTAEGTAEPEAAGEEGMCHAAFDDETVPSGRYLLEAEAEDRGPEEGGVISGIREVTYCLTREGQAGQPLAEGVLLEREPAGTVDDVREPAGAEGGSAELMGDLDGCCVLTVSAADFAGNRSSVSVKLIFDSTPPEVTISGKPVCENDLAAFYGADGAIEVCAADLHAVAEFEVRANGTALTPEEAGLTDARRRTWTWKTGGRELPDGPVKITFRARDEAGNETSAFRKISGMKSSDGNRCAAFLLDRATPEIHCSMSGGRKEGDRLYYNGENAVLSVRFAGFTDGGTSPLRDYEIRVEDRYGRTYRKNPGPGDIESGRTSGKEVKLNIAELSESGMRGVITVSARASDCSGNTADRISSCEGMSGSAGDSEVTFILDRAAPDVRVSMSKPLTDYYFREDNCAVSAAVRDEDFSGLRSCTLTLLAGGRSITASWPEEGGRGEENALFKKTFSAPEVCSLVGRGSVSEVTLRVEAEDLAGNRTRKLTAVNMACGRDEDGPSAAFILDRENPEVTGIATEGTAKGDGREPYDGLAYYYNDAAVRTVFTAAETHPGVLTLSYRSGGRRVTARVRGVNRISTDYGGSAEASLSEIAVSGCDLAGNPLVPARAYRHGACDEAEASVRLRVSPGKVKYREGTVALRFGKVIDRTPPRAVIRCASSAPAYLYGSPDQNAGSAAAAYFNRAVTAAVTIRDTRGGETGEEIAAGLDPEKLFVGRNGGKGRALQTSSFWRKGASVIRCAYSVTPERDGDGVYWFTVYGTDRAGNALTVTECMPDSAVLKGGRAPENMYETAGRRTSYVPRLKFVLDTKAPVFTLALPDPVSPAGVQGKTAYYGQGDGGDGEQVRVSGTFRIEEKNFDDQRIGTGASYGTGDLFSKVKPVRTGVRSGSGYIGGRTYRQTMGADGVFRLEISGCDKAGNRLRQSGGEAAKRGFRATAERGSGSGRFCTCRKVIDSAAPEAVLSVGDFYRLFLKPSGTLPDSGNNLYPKRRSADFVIESRDCSPVNIRCEIDSKVREQDFRFSDERYEDNRRISRKLRGEQEVVIKGIMITDRAGNETKLSGTGRLYMDVTPPAGSVSAPLTAVRAETAPAARSAGGRDLFNGEVRLVLRAEDPNPGTASSGIRKIRYTVKADGRLLTDRTEYLSPVRVESGPEDVGGADRAVSSWSDTLIIPASGIFENSDIEVELSAEDRAGSRSDPETGGLYRFGIDTRGPQITVSFDNNAVRNGRYFNAERTAYVTVRERNPGSGGIRIETEVPVSAAQSGDPDGSEDGDGESQRMRLLYSADGDYTLRISGTDALGNAAEVSCGDSAAPWDFTVDRTAPVIAVRGIDRDRARENLYFRSDLRAVVEITERNPGPDCHVTADGVHERSGRAVSGRIGSFSGSGERRRAEIFFSEEGRYRITAACTDLAGNPAEEQSEPDFIIDKTKPALRPLRDIGAKSFGGAFHPAFAVDDDYYDPGATSAVLKGRKNTCDVQVPDGPYGGPVAFPEFETEKAADDVYDFRVTAEDRAGNRAVFGITFSLNRFGSTFDYGSAGSRRLTEEIRCTASPPAYCIREINLDPVTERRLTLYRDGEAKDLSAGRDYRVSERRTAFGYEYFYAVDPSCFEAEGRYLIAVVSEDAAGNISTNSAKDAGGDGSGVPYEFAVDRTPPAVYLTGADPGEDCYDAGSLPVTVSFYDNMSVSRVLVETGRDRGGPEILADLAGTELSDYLEEKGERFDYTFAGDGIRRYIRVTAWDAAGNAGEPLVFEAVVSRNPLIRLRGTVRAVFVPAGAALLLPALILLCLLSGRRRAERGRKHLPGR